MGTFLILKHADLTPEEAESLFPSLNAAGWTIKKCYAHDPEAPASVKQLAFMFEVADRLWQTTAEVDAGADMLRAMILARYHVKPGWITVAEASAILGTDTAELDANGKPDGLLGLERTEWLAERQRQQQEANK